MGPGGARRPGNALRMGDAVLPATLHGVRVGREWEGNRATATPQRRLALLHSQNRNVTIAQVQHCAIQAQKNKDVGEGPSSQDSHTWR